MTEKSSLEFMKEMRSAKSAMAFDKVLAELKKATVVEDFDELIETARKVDRDWGTTPSSKARLEEVIAHIERQRSLGLGSSIRAAASG